MIPEVLGLVAELRFALDLHDRTYPDGDWKGANDRIGQARIKTDEFIFNTTGHRVTGTHGNDQVLDILKILGKREK